MPQLQINQGPQDALLYDNTRSYFTNVGYVRTSNFQVEYRNVDPQNTPQFGSTVQYVIPKAADLLGPVDLRVTIPEVSLEDSGFKAGLTGSAVTDVTGIQAYSQWVDELGFAMIEKCTFSVGSNDIETITGEQMQIKNELMTSDEQRIGFDHVLKTGRKAFVDTSSNEVFELPGTYEHGKKKHGSNDTTLAKHVNKDYTRLIGVHHSGDKMNTCGERSLIIPLNMFFTKHVSQYFPLAAVAGCNDVRISVKFRNLKELIQLGGIMPKGNDVYKPTLPTISKLDAKLMCHYVHVTGPEATTLMNKEHVRLLKLWQHQHKTFNEASNSLDLDLSFLHPITTLLITIRRANDMNTSDGCKTDASQADDMVAGTDLSGKGFFFYHGDGTNPNYDTDQTDQGTVKVKSIQLTLNGQERHPGLNEGIDADYLNHRLLPMLHSNSNQYQKQLFATASPSVSSTTTSAHEMHVATCVAGTNGYGGSTSGTPNRGVASYAGTIAQVGDKVYDEDGALLGTVNGTSSKTSIISDILDADVVSGGALMTIRRPVAVSSNTSTSAPIEAERAKYSIQGSKNIFVYPFSLNPEGSNPSGAVNFSKVSHAKLRLNLDVSEVTGSGLKKAANGMPGGSTDPSALRVDVYGMYYNWLQIKSGRALLSFA